MGKAKKWKTQKRLSHPYQPKSSKPKKAIPKAQSDKQQQRAADLQNQQQRQQKPPFQPDDRILLVGEGDFSFADSLYIEHGCTTLVATTFETRTNLLSKYPQTALHITSLESGSHQVLYSIDATKLGHSHTPGAAFLRKSRFDVIIFNFPHVGGKSTDVNRQVRSNQELVAKFLGNAKGLLDEGGRVLLTVFEGQPYELWGVRNLARHVGLNVESSMKFEASMYPGYKHVRTLGTIEGGGGWRGEERKARMFVFVDNDNGGAVRRRAEEDEDEDE